MADCGHLAVIATSGEARGLCPLCLRAEVERLTCTLRAIVREFPSDDADRLRRIAKAALAGKGE